VKSDFGRLFSVALRHLLPLFNGNFQDFGHTTPLSPVNHGAPDTDLPEQTS
jgi:hypothetical protein